jgi:hypothetical protein
MLDYAANATAHWPVAHMQERFAAICKSQGIDPVVKLQEFIGGDADPQEFWSSANRNLQARKIRLLFVADVIPTELQRIVEFLNEQMDQTEVLAIEIKQYVGQHGHRTLVPRVIGQTTEAQERKFLGSHAEKQWNERSVLDAITERRGAAEADVARKLIKWSQRSAVNWGKGVNDGSFAPVFEFGSAYPFIPFRVYTYGSVEILFNRMVNRDSAPFDQQRRRLELLGRLNAIPSVSVPEDAITRRPPILLADLVNPSSFDSFIQTIEWAVQEVKSYQDN